MSVVFISGCMGKRELNELAIVMAVGLDKGEKEGDIKVTVQVVRPADARGQTGAPAANTGDPIWSASAEGKTIFGAIRNLTKFSSRRVFWAHNQVIVINEDLAKEGIREIIDFFSRNPELRMRTWVVVSPDPASKIVSTMTGLEVVPGEAINKLFRYTMISAQAPQTEMIDLQAAYLSESSEPLLARVKLIDRGVSNKKPGQAGSVEQVELAGAGVFKGDKLIGVFEPEETRGLLPFIEKVESGVLPLKCPNDEGKKISVELRHMLFKVTPKFKNGKPEFHIRSVTNASMAEAGCYFSMKDREQVQKLEKELSSLIYKDIKNVVDKVQNEFDSDILELGKVFKNKYPAEWKSISKDWDKELRTAKINIEVEAKINDAVLLYKPTKTY
jgi:spore germination protein KC